jgi:hypothetical protein
MATAIVLVLHSWGHMAELPLSLKSEMTPQQANTVQKYYCRWIISPLRRFIDVLEINMSTGQWSKIDCERISDECLAKKQAPFFST